MLRACLPLLGALVLVGCADLSRPTPIRVSKDTARGIPSVVRLPGNLRAVPGAKGGTRVIQLGGSGAAKAAGVARPGVRPNAAGAVRRPRPPAGTG